MGRSRRPSPSSPQKRHDLGVLFVHGIGLQQRGETLERFGGLMRPGFHVVVISGIVDLRRRETRHDGTPEEVLRRAA